MGATMGRWGVRAGLVLMAIGAGTGVVHAAGDARSILDRARALEEGERRWSDRHEHLALSITTSTGGTRIGRLCARRDMGASRVTASDRRLTGMATPEGWGAGER